MHSRAESIRYELDKERERAETAVRMILTARTQNDRDNFLLTFADAQARIKTLQREISTHPNSTHSESSTMKTTLQQHPRTEYEALRLAARAAIADDSRGKDSAGELSPWNNQPGHVTKVVARAQAKLIKAGYSGEILHRTLKTIGAGGTGPVPIETYERIEDNTLGESVALRDFLPVEIGSGKTSVAAISTAATAAFNSETVRTDPSDAAFSVIEVTTQRLAAACSMSTEISEDVPPLESTLERHTASAMAWKLDSAGFCGDGSAPYGGFTGMLYSAGHVVTLGAGKTDFTDVQAEDLRSAITLAPARKRIAAKWFMGPEILNHVLGLTDLQGRYIFQNPAGQIFLFGFPVEPVGAMDDMTTGAGKRFIAFGDPRRMILGTRNELKIRFSKGGVIDNGTDVSLNALQADAVIMIVSRRVAVAALDIDGLVAIKTAAA